MNILLKSKLILALATILFGQSAICQGQEILPDFTSFDLESLMQTEVDNISSISRRRQQSFNAPSATFVITSQDIAQSSATHVAELLRMVPGFHVGKMNSSSYNVASRGGGGLFLNKLLVLLDGRSIYNPSLGGVYWDVQSPPLHTIERIEIIRGPGAMLWGLNAMNGVIAIVTKNSLKSLGTHVSLGSGTEEQAIAEASFSELISDHTSIRLHGSFNKRDDGTRPITAGRLPAGDDWGVGRVGARADYNADYDVISLHADFVTAQLNNDQPALFEQNIVNRDAEASEFALITKWSRKFESDSDFSAQVYFDNVERDDEYQAKQHRQTYDLDLQYHKQWNYIDIVTGLGARYWDDTLVGSSTAQLNPNSETFNVVHSFFQLESELFSPSISLTVGSKVSHNEFTGWEYQPGARLAWSVNPDYVLWTGYMRAVRLPSRFDRSGFANLRSIPAPDGSFGLVQARGTRSISSENLQSFEVGARRTFGSTGSFDLALFYNKYDDLTGSSIEPAESGTFMGREVIFLPQQIRNNATSNTYGGELQVTFNLLENLSIDAWYSFIRNDVFYSEPDDSNIDIDNPESQAFVRTNFKISDAWTCTNYLRYVEAIEFFGDSSDTYLQLDTVLSWKPKDSLRIKLVGQNLLRDNQQEFPDQGFGTGAVNPQRGFYVTVNLDWK